jgi:hypothetical protein
MKYIMILLTSLFLVSNASAEGTTASEVILDGKLFKEETYMTIYLYKDEFYDCRFKSQALTCHKFKVMGTASLLNDKYEVITSKVILDGKFFKKTEHDTIYLYKDEFYSCDFSKHRDGGNYKVGTLICDKIIDKGILIGS